MFGKDFGQFLKSMRTAGPAMGNFNKASQAGIAIMQMKRKLLGPIVDLYYDFKANVELVTDVLGMFSETVGKVLTFLIPFGKATEFISEGLKGITGTVLFLITLFLTVSAVLIGLTGSFSGATQTFPEFFAGFESIKNSALEMIGHLQTIGGAIMEVDFGPLLEAAGFAIGGIILLIVNFYDAAIGAVSDVLGTFAELFTYMSETGAFDAIVIGFAGILNAVTLTFSYVFQILDAFGINFTNIFGAVTTVFSGFVGFLINSGLLAFFADVIMYIGLILPPVVFVVGEILLLIAKLIAMLVGPLFTTFFNVGKLILNVVALVMTTIITVVRAAMAIIGGILELVVAVFTGNWGDIPDIIGGILGDLGDIFTDFLDSVTNIFGNIKDAIIGAITGAIDFVMGPIDEVLGKIEDVTGIGDKLGGVGDFLGSLNPFSMGGIATGPASGYPAMLHGTEAVVPLPDGKSIPVTMQGMDGAGGGENITVNISVSGGGNAQEVARAVSQEVQRVFRNRSRGGGFGRGVI